MSTYRFSNAQRYAIFLAHGMKCYLCGHPLDLVSMVVDHVLPEGLLANPSSFKAAKTKLGLPDSFSLNSFENWLPACSPCNAKKSALQFNPSPLVQVELQNLAQKANKARQLSSEVVSDRKVSIALNTLERAQESGRSFDGAMRKRLLDLLRFAKERELLLGGQPLCLTQSFRLLTTAVNDAESWGATHWSFPLREQGEPALSVLLRAGRGLCVQCGLRRQIFQPINQDGGGDPICGICLSNLDWTPPVIFGSLPTHVVQADDVMFRP